MTCQLKMSLLSQYPVLTTNCCTQNLSFANCFSLRNVPLHILREAFFFSKITSKLILFCRGCHFCPNKIGTVHVRNVPIKAAPLPVPPGSCNVIFVLKPCRICPGSTSEMSLFHVRNVLLPCHRRTGWMSLLSPICVRNVPISCQKRPFAEVFLRCFFAVLSDFYIPEQCPK